MPRNLLIDVEALAGSELKGLAVVAKRNEDGERDTYGPGKFVHMEVGDAPGKSDFGRAHRTAFEFLNDVPGSMKRRDGGALFTFDGLPVHASPPATQGPRRNMLLDVEDMVGGGRLLAAVLVPKRHNGPPPDWGTGPAQIPNPWVKPTKPPPMPYDPETGEPLYPEDQWPPAGWDEKPDDWPEFFTALWAEPGVTPPTEHYGPDTFLHCLIADDEALADDLGDQTARAREFLAGAPPFMRRGGNGGPVHVFFGQPVHITKPSPPGPFEP